MQNFSNSWIKGSKSSTPDTVKKHVTYEMHKQTADLTFKKELGPKRYTDNVCQNTPITKSTTKMYQKPRKVLKNRFKTAYYLAKKEKLQITQRC